MVIIQRTRKQINQLSAVFSEFSGPNVQERIQQYVMKDYAEACFMFEKEVRDNKGVFEFLFAGTGTSVPASIIHSTHRRSFVLSGAGKIDLTLSQIRSKDRRHYEDILLEPFYPGFCAPLHDIYVILYESIQSDHPKCCRFERSYPYATRYSIRRKITERLKVILEDDDITPVIRSYDSFYQAIHSLSSDQLMLLFNTHITFVSLECNKIFSE